MTTSIARRPFTRVALPWLALLAAGGCTAISMSQPAGIEPLANASAEAPPTCTVEFRSRRHRPEVVNTAWRQGMVVQDALTQTEAMRRFRRMRVDVYRESMPGQKRAKMQVAYDYRAHRVDPATDYALHPGDHIVVQEDAKTILDDMLDDALKPLGPLLGPNL